jgi:hypothetical protein
MTTTTQIGLDSPIGLMTPRQLFQMQEQWLLQRFPNIFNKSEDSSRWFVNSISDLADILGTSKTTLYGMKQQGLLDDAISQYGRWQVIDVNKVIEIFKLSKRNATKRDWKQCK